MTAGTPAHPPSTLLAELRALPSFTPGREREHASPAPSSAPTFNTRELATIAAGGTVETPQSRQRRRALDRAKTKEARREKTEAERRARFLATSRKRGCELMPNDVPAAARQIVWRTMRGQRSAERELARLKRHAYGSAIERAAFGTAATSARGLRRGPYHALRSIRARRVVACGAVLAFLSQVTTSHGRAFIVEGTLRGTFCTFFQNAEGDAVHVNTLFGTMTDGTRRGRWDCGAVVALERAGAIEKIQPPPHTQRARFVGLDRKRVPRALNQYFLRNDVVGGDAAAVEARASTAWELWLAGRPARAARRAETRGPPTAAQL